MGSGEVFCEMSNAVQIELARGIHWENRTIMTAWHDRLASGRLLGLQSRLRSSFP